MNESAVSQAIVFRRGQRVILRPNDNGDVSMLQRWVNDPDVSRFVLQPFPVMELAERAWVEKTAHERDKNVVVIIAVMDGETQVPIGIMGLHRINWVSRYATSGAVIGEKAYWGRGFGSEAKMVLLEYAFNTLGLNKVTSEVMAFNHRSQRYNEKCGYEVVGRHKRHIFRNGRWHDLVMMEVHRQPWCKLWRAYVKNGVRFSV